MFKSIAGWTWRRLRSVEAAARRRLGLKSRPAAAQDRSRPVNHVDIDPKTMRIHRRG